VTAAYDQIKLHKAVLARRRDHLIAQGGLFPEIRLSYWKEKLAEARASGLEPTGVSGAFVLDVRVNNSPPLRPQPRHFLGSRKTGGVL
jgi:hypothetical protein